MSNAARRDASPVECRGTLVAGSYIRPGVHLRRSPGKLFSRRGPFRFRLVDTAQCKKQGVEDLAGTEQIDAPGRRTVRSAGLGLSGRDLRLASSSGGRL
jgi:hypothetical protein